MAILGQAAALLFVHFGLGFAVPLGPTLGLVAASALFNGVLMIAYPRPRRLADREATLHLAFDILQLTGLLYFTGGLENPFSLLIIVPVTICATNLSGRSTISLVMLALAAISFLALFHQPLPGYNRIASMNALYLTGIWAALMLGIPFTAIYGWRVADEARRRSEALAATQLALSREQKLSALGGLAAAAAHELGTPLGTISVVAKELKRAFPEDSPYADDLALLQSQVVRCRDILANLSQQPEASEQGHFKRLPLTVLLDEAAAPFRDMDDSVSVEMQVAETNSEEPLIPRQPEIIHALGNFIENAVDFAESTVILSAEWDDTDVRLFIEDDGPGFPPHVLNELGEPYVTSRLGGQAAAERHHDGLGLGIFIAKTLLERTGAALIFANRPEGGARIAISWPRIKLMGEEETISSGFWS